MLRRTTDVKLEINDLPVNSKQIVNIITEALVIVLLRVVVSKEVFEDMDLNVSIRVQEVMRINLYINEMVKVIFGSVVLLLVVKEELVGHL